MSFDPLVEAATSPQHILLVCNRLNMARVHASMIAAQVIAFQPSRDGANECLIANSMGEREMAPPPKLPIATCLATRCPLPASIFEDANFPPETGWKPGVTKGRGVKLRTHRKTSPFGVMQPEVIGLAAAFIVAQGGLIN